MTAAVLRRYHMREREDDTGSEVSTLKARSVLRPGSTESNRTNGRLRFVTQSKRNRSGLSKYFSLSVMSIPRRASKTTFSRMTTSTPILMMPILTTMTKPLASRLQSLKLAESISRRKQKRREKKLMTNGLSA